MRPGDLVVDALATFRLTRLLTADTIAEPVRVRWEESAKVAGYPDDIIDVIRCGWCVGFWCAVFVRTARKVAPRVWGPVAEVLACAAVAGALSDR